MSDLPLFLCALASILLAVVGVLALVSPARLSRSYGIPVDTPAALGYVRATGTRDLIIGAIFGASVYLHDEGILLALAVAGVVLSLADFTIACTFAGRFHGEHAAHLAGAAGFAVIAGLLITRVV